MTGKIKKVDDGYYLLAGGISTLFDELQGAIETADKVGITLEPTAEVLGYRLGTAICAVSENEMQLSDIITALDETTDKAYSEGAKKLAAALLDWAR